MLKKIYHVGLAVRDLDKAIQFFKQTYGAKLLWRRTFEPIAQESAFMELGEEHFEIACSLSPDGVMAKFIETRGEGIHHISWEVDDMDRTVKELRDRGLTVIGEVTTDLGKVAFVHPKNNMGMLMELYQPLN